VVYEQRVVNKDFFEDRPKEEQEVNLLEGVSDVHFEYFREEDNEKTRAEGWLTEWNAKEEKELPTALRMTVKYRDGRNEKEETSFTLLASISAHQYEDLKTVPGYRLRPSIRQRLQ
jgi:hypothetical protein